MRVNIYAEEMTDRVEIISKTIEGQTFTGLRLYLELPVTLPRNTDLTPDGEAPPDLNSGVRTARMEDGRLAVQGPFIHHPGDDDSAAVTFWGKRDLRVVLRKMLAELDTHYAERGALDEPRLPPPSGLQPRLR